MLRVIFKHTYLGAGVVFRHTSTQLRVGAAAPGHFCLYPPKIQRRAVAGEGDGLSFCNHRRERKASFAKSFQARTHCSDLVIQVIAHYQRRFDSLCNESLASALVEFVKLQVNVAAARAASYLRALFLPHDHPADEDGCFRQRTRRKLVDSGQAWPKSSALNSVRPPASLHHQQPHVVFDDHAHV